jgi:hypothetical protein
MRSTRASDIGTGVVVFYSLWLKLENEDALE